VITRWSIVERTQDAEPVSSVFGPESVVVFLCDLRKMPGCVSLVTVTIVGALGEMVDRHHYAFPLWCA
jgi:hypothetical protein